MPFLFFPNSPEVASDWIVFSFSLLNAPTEIYQILYTIKYKLFILYNYIQIIKVAMFLAVWNLTRIEALNQKN